MSHPWLQQNGEIIRKKLTAGTISKRPQTSEGFIGGYVLLNVEVNGVSYVFIIVTYV